MGRGQKGKGKDQQKPKSKFTQRSAQNKKQLAMVDRILQTKKDRSQSKDTKSDKPAGKFDKSAGKFDKSAGKFDKSAGKFDKSAGKFGKRGGKFDKPAGKFDKSAGKFDKPAGKFDRTRENQSVQRGKPSRGGKRGNSKQHRSESEWTEKTNTKTKQISKQFGSGKQMKRKPFGNDDQGKQVLKGNPLFKIVPEGMDDDDFAVLGEENEEEHSGDSEVSQQQGEGEEYEAQQGEDQEQLQEEGEQDEGQEQIDEELIDEQDLAGLEEGLQFDEDGQQDLEGQEEDSDQQEDGQQMEQKPAAKEEQADQQGDQQAQGNMLALPGDNQPVDISVISLKIQQTIQILMNVGRLGAGKTRKQHLQDLKNLIHQYYGYNFELISHFLDFFNPSELIQFFEANETQRPLTIRTNTLKTRRKELAQSLIQRGVNLDPLADWSSVGIKIYETKVPIGATPEYLAGQYMLQSASSFLPVVALDPQPYEKVLDMAAAPGGKTTYIAQMMKNTGCLFANDLKKERLRALQFNLYRLGVTNTAVTCRDGRKFPAIFPSTFDKILLDAPCTGLGIISKDPSIKATRQMIDIYKNSHLQKELLLAAIDCCKVNGTVVYSTCSVSPLQNEEVVNYALKRRFIKIVECGIDVGQEGLTKFVEKRFHVDLKKTRRIYPHVHNMDGFYVAKIVKVGKGKKEVKQEQGEQLHHMIEEIELAHEA